MKKRQVIGVTAVAILGVAWYLFRPELLFINRQVKEEFPSANASTGDRQLLVARGSFHGVAHEGKGTAAIHQTADGKRLLRLEDFETSNGPALHVYLVAAADATDSDTVKKADVLDLGALKGNVGDQNYDVPDGADLYKYKAVTIWCQRFSVNFATAPLTSAPVERPSRTGDGK
jgi:hypothetical protein